MSGCSRSIQTVHRKDMRCADIRGGVLCRIAQMIGHAFSLLAIKCRLGHQEKAAARSSWALLALLLVTGLLGASQEARAGDRDELFWQDVGGVAAPFQPVEVLPLETEERFIPATGDVDTLQGISFSYQAVNHRYQLDGLWDDRGTTLHLLENRGLSQDAYIQRFGFPAGRRAGGLTLKNPESGISFRYRTTADATALTEPEGYGSYQWEKSADGKTYVTIDTNSARTSAYQPETLDFGTTYYRCIATAAGEEFTLGENYAVMYYRLPVARGLRIREVTHAN